MFNNNNRLFVVFAVFPHSKQLRFCAKRQKVAKPPANGLPVDFGQTVLKAELAPHSMSGIQIYALIDRHSEHYIDQPNGHEENEGPNGVDEVDVQEVYYADAGKEVG